MQCEDPIHRFPMSARICQCGKVSVPQPEFKNITGFGSHRRSIGAATYIKGYKSPDDLFAARSGPDKWEREGTGAANADIPIGPEEIRNEDADRAV